MGAPEVGFGLLGPVQVTVGERQVDVGAARARCLLAVLLWDAGRVVPVDRLVECVWGDASLPEKPRRAVQTYVSLLRRALAGVGGADIVRSAGGYLIAVDDQCIDVRRFRVLVAQARVAERDERVGELFEQALGLWRGEAFGTLDTPWANDKRAWLDQERQSVERDLTDCQLRQGLHATILAGLVTAAAEQPLDERLAGQLMLALFRAGRQADALAHYHRLSRQLAEELGADPGAALRHLHQRILTHDPTLAAPTPRPVAEVAPAPVSDPATVLAHSRTVPRQLPAPPRLFTGRGDETARLDTILAEAGEPVRALAIAAISGTGGVGKTWLAVHWAHEHIDRFPDGQLFVNMHGFDRTDPLSPAMALRGFLEALGVDPSVMPAGLDAQAGLYRSLLAEKRMLVVLDNVRDGDQVVPLLPGCPSCTVVVTSRHRLADLVASHGARPLELDVLAESEARQVLVQYLGRDRVEAEPGAVAEVLACCAGLPLALGIVAARALVRPQPSLTELAAELRDAAARLEALDAGSMTVNLRATLSCSYDALSSDASAGLGLLALAPGADISSSAAAALLGFSGARLRRVLSDLEQASLLQQHTAGRYRMHDLVRLYAVERAETDHPMDERDAALRRLLDFYTDAACAADYLLDPVRRPLRLDSSSLGVERPDLPELPKLPDSSAALGWFQDEHANILAAQRTAVAHSWHATVWQLAWALCTFQNRRGLPEDALAQWQAAAEAAVHLPGYIARTFALRFLGYTHAELSEYPTAVGHLREALVLAEDHRDRTEQARCHLVLGRVWELSGDYERALSHSLRAADLHHGVGEPAWEAEALNSVGWCAAHLGDYDTARARCQAALVLQRDHHDPDGEAATLDSLGFIERHCGNQQQAIELYQQALALRRRLDNTYASASVLSNLGELHATLGQHHEARTAWQEALALYQAHQRDNDVERILRHLASLSP
ncbi:MAG: tetratricopeptide repeat protein [Catenulispora sp.]|nr:tetratricopeptide repeat protein [Catenulispora sp.]